MSNGTKIEWTEQTWNPTTGCTKISPGCKHCYAETMSHRLQAMGAGGYDNGFELSLQPHRLEQPLRRRKPTIYFVNSMSDLFHEGIPDSYLDQVFRRDSAHTSPHLSNPNEKSRAPARVFYAACLPGERLVGRIGRGSGSWCTTHRPVTTGSCPYSLPFNRASTGGS